MKKLILITLLLPWMVVANAQTKRLKPMFNGKNLQGWSSFLRTSGLNNDPQQVFVVEKKMIHVRGKEFGYIITDKGYKDFHFSVDFKWGVEKYAPRLTAVRDAGICFNIPIGIPNKIWPLSVECQIQEGDVGDIWLLDRATAVVDGKVTTPGNSVRVQKKKDNERPTGDWNTVEVVSKNGKFSYYVNGLLVNEGENASTKEGRILLQAEGAELFYRNIKIAEL
jgi:Domain of Unknown Function (DUF1080)